MRNVLITIFPDFLNFHDIQISIFQEYGTYGNPEISNLYESENCQILK